MYPQCLNENSILITNKFLFYEHEEPQESDGFKLHYTNIGQNTYIYIPEFVKKRRAKIKNMEEIVQKQE